MILAIINGLITSIILETIILSRQTDIGPAFRTALSMSLISMLSMEIAMNLVDGRCRINTVGGTSDVNRWFHYAASIPLLAIKKVGLRLLWLVCNLHCS